MSRYLVVGDLHLGPGHGDDVGRPFARFLEHVLRSEPPASTHIVLLGDVVDLVGGTAEDECARLGAIARRHADVFAALGALVAAGFTLHVVPGNHDLALARPAVHAVLRDLVGAVRLHQRALEVPGVLRAEHGHHHHAGNRPVVDAASAPPGRLALPLLGEFDVARAQGRTAAAAATLALRAGARRPSLLRPVPRLVGRGVRRRVRRATTQRGDYLHRAARSAAGSSDAAVFVFGHTHVAEVFALGDDHPDRWYANAGSWTTGTRRYLRVAAHPVSVTLEAWE